MRMPVMALSLLTLPLVLSGCIGVKDSGSGGDSTGGDVLVCEPVAPPSDTSATCGNGAVEYGEFCDTGPTGACDLCELGGVSSMGAPQLVVEGVGEDLCFYWEENKEDGDYTYFGCGMRVGEDLLSLGDIDGDCLEDFQVRAAFGPTDSRPTNGTTTQQKTLPYVDGTYVYLGRTLAEAGAGNVLTLDDADGLHVRDPDSPVRWDAPVAVHVAERRERPGPGTRAVAAGPRRRPPLAPARRR